METIKVNSASWNNNPLGVSSDSMARSSGMMPLPNAMEKLYNSSEKLRRAKEKLDLEIFNQHLVGFSGNG